MDRNLDYRVTLVPHQVALRKESVDRNDFPGAYLVRNAKSLSARRAWIEIGTCRSSNSVGYVALRKESVDRNNHHLADDLVESSSLSARRAWIEIYLSIIL